MRAPTDFDRPSRRVWRTVLDELIASGAWSDATAPLAELYVRALQTARLARERIARRLAEGGETEAFFTLGSMRQLVAHPDLGIARQAEADALAYGRELLLSPAARRRHRIADADLSGLSDADLERWISA